MPIYILILLKYSTIGKTRNISGVTLLLSVFESELDSLLNERHDRQEILVEMFNPERQYPRQGQLFADYIKMLIAKSPQKLIPGELLLF